MTGKEFLNAVARSEVVGAERIEAQPALADALPPDLHEKLA